MASRWVPEVLAIDFNTRPWPTPDLGGNEGPHHPDGDRELLARAEDPGRADGARGTRQLRETFPDAPTHRYPICDDDARPTQSHALRQLRWLAIFSTAVTSAIKSFEIDPKRTAFRSPWQNGTAERVVGTIRRELLDHVVVLNEDHLRRLLREYVDYSNDERVHTSISDAPVGRPVESRPSSGARVVGWPRVGGLQHRYRRREAA